MRAISGEMITHSELAEKIRGAVEEGELNARPSIEIGAWLSGMTRRVESQIRSDWLFIRDASRRIPPARCYECAVRGQGGAGEK